MARLPGLLKRTSKAEELALEEARQGSIARLERLLAQRAGVAMADDSVDDDIEIEDDTSAEAAAEAEAEPVILALSPGGALTAGEESADGASDEDAVVARALALTPAGVPVMEPSAIDATRRLAVRHRPSAVVIEDDWDGTGDQPEPHDPLDLAADLTEPALVAAGAVDEGEAHDGIGGADPLPAPKAPARTPRRRAAKPADEPPKVTVEPPVDQRRVVPPPPPRVGAKAVPIHPKRPKRQRRQPLVLAACPSCAVLLDPRPTTSKRCARCRERIVVKRVEGGVLYLTATAGAALEEAQRNVKIWARLARARDRWLTQAAAVGAPSQRLVRVARPMPSEEQVAAARDLYFTTAGRAYATARREHRFADAASIRRAHAQALHRDLGSPQPVPEEVLALYRDAHLAELRVLRDVGRDAELVTTCCDACRVDAGLIVRIPDELKNTRLPHASCEQGLCRCRWSPARTGGKRPTAGRAAGR